MKMRYIRFMLTRPNANKRCCSNLHYICVLLLVNRYLKLIMEKISVYIFAIVQTELFFIACAYSSQSTNNQKNLPSKVKHAEAETQCSERGMSLLTYSQALDTFSTNELLTQMGKNDSFWISGYAEYSPFLAWHGCVKLKSVHAFTTVLSQASLYLCIETCLSLNQKNYTLFLGMRNRLCFCLEESKRAEFITVNRSMCNQTCTEPGTVSCGGYNEISVYHMYYDYVPYIGHWADHQPSVGQCVYVEKTKTTLKAYTASCYRQDEITGDIGVICRETEYSELSNICLDKIGTYCLLEENLSRQDALELCTSYNGTLAYLNSEVVAMMKVNSKYWIDVYRIFRATYVRSRTKPACLALTKQSDRLFLDVDNCSTLKPFICQQDYQTTLFSSTASDRKEIIRATTECPMGDQIIQEELNPIAYILPTIVFVFVGATIVTCFTCRRQLRPQAGRDASKDMVPMKSQVTSQEIIPNDDSVNKTTYDYANPQELHDYTYIHPKEYTYIHPSS